MTPSDISLIPTATVSIDSPSTLPQLSSPPPPETINRITSLAKQSFQYLRSNSVSKGITSTISSIVQKLSPLGGVISLVQGSCAVHDAIEAYHSGDETTQWLETLNATMYLMDAGNSAMNLIDVILHSTDMVFPWIQTLGAPIDIVFNTLGGIANSLGIAESTKFLRRMGEITIPPPKSTKDAETDFLRETHEWLHTYMPKLELTPEQRTTLQAEVLKKIPGTESDLIPVKRIFSRTRSFFGSKPKTQTVAEARLKLFKQKKHKQLNRAPTTGKRRFTQRCTSKKIAAQMKTARKILDNPNKNHEERLLAAKTVIANAQQVAIRRRRSRMIGLLGNVAAVIGMTLFFVAVPPLIPFAIIGTVQLVRIAKWLYDHFYLDRVHIDTLPSEESEKG